MPEENTLHKEKKNIITTFQDKRTVGILAGSILIILSSFMPWAEAVTIFGSINISGTTGDGKLTVLIGLLIITVVILGKTVFKKKKNIQKILPFIIYIFAVIALGIVVWDGVKVSSAFNEYVKSSAGIGIYVVFFGGIVTISSIVVSFIKREKKVLAYILIALLILIVVGSGIIASQNSKQSKSESTVTTSENKPEEVKKSKIEVISKYYQKSSSQTAYINGELKNTGDADAYIDDITVTLLSGGKVVASSSSLYNPDKILKGETVPYQAMINNPPAYEEIKVVATAKSESYSQVYRLDIISQTPRDDEYGGFSVAGEIENKTSKNLQSAEVFVWLLDSNNDVVGLATTFVENIDKNTKKPYEASFYFSQDEKPEVNNIKVLAESTH